MKQIYDEKQEKIINDFFKNLYKNSYDNTFPKELLNQLLEYYDISKYPGVYYRIAKLYEMGVFRKFDKDKSIEYFIKASKEGYVPAMNRLAEIELNELELNDFKYAYWVSKSGEEYNDPYGKYLLAKYHLLYGIVNNENHLKRGFELMKESAKQGCYEAYTYLNTFKEMYYSIEK